MSITKLKWCAIFLFSLGATGIQAQEIHETIPASGGNASGSGGTVSYSVGQVVYTTNTGTNGTVAQGIQQAYEISVITAVEEAKDISLSAYPNPTADYLTLEVNAFQHSSFRFQLYDMNGKLLQREEITSKQTTIVMGDLPTATYFVKVIRNNKEIKTFKIIKTH